MIIQNEQQLEVLREGGRKLALVLLEVSRAARPGVATIELDRLAEHLIREAGGDPVFKGYKTRLDPRPYPGTLCVSVNDEVVHGIPSEKRILQDGDIVGLDIGMRWPSSSAKQQTTNHPDFVSGKAGETKSRILDSSTAISGGTNRDKPQTSLITDTAITIGIGKISSEAEKLIRVTKESLDLAISLLKPGLHLGDLGEAVQHHLEDNGFGVVRELAGHGVGEKLHEEPYVMNYGKKGEGIRLKENQVIAIEPMATAGDHVLKLSKDGWTFKTRDGGLAAHFEHSVVILKNGAEILTL